MLEETYQIGVIISDNGEDRYEKGKDKTTWEYTTNLKGNQYVWIPCETSEYTKRDWGKQNANWDSTTYGSEKSQIEKYGGFYVARYEAGLASDIPEFTETQTHTGTNQIYNKSGIPQSKAGQIPWIFIDWNNSKANAESMYDTDYVGSGLITGTQWDVMLKKIIEKTDITEADVVTNSSKWGNYKNTQIAYKGRLSKAYYSSSRWYQPKFGEVQEGTTGNYGTSDTANYGDLLTTGASAATEKYHIYDVAGNVWEWTEEASYYGGNTAIQYRVIRGGSDLNVSSTYPACYRNGNNTVSNTNLNIGFRPVLYIK